MTDNFIGFDDKGNTIVECWSCGGEGTFADCQEEYACIDPEGGCEFCMRRCDICGGKGRYTIPDEPERTTPSEDPR